MKFLTLVLAVLMAAALTACGQERAAETAQTPTEIAETVIASQTGLPSFIQIVMGDEEFNAYLSNYYSLDQAQISDGVIAYVDGVEASEIAVLILEDAMMLKRWRTPWPFTWRIVPVILRVMLPSRRRW